MEEVKFKRVACPNCGAPINLDDTNRGKCEYCGTDYHVEKLDNDPSTEEVVSDIIDFVGDQLVDALEDSNAKVDPEFIDNMKKTKHIGKKLLYIIGTILLLVIMEIFNS